MPEQHVAAIHLRQWIELYRGRGITVRVFDGPDSALLWLETL
jgi:hypothetical protein